MARAIIGNRAAAIDLLLGMLAIVLLFALDRERTSLSVAMHFDAFFVLLLLFSLFAFFAGRLTRFRCGWCWLVV